MTVRTTQDWLDEGRSRAALQAELAAGRLVRVRRGVVMPADDPDALTLHGRKLRAARHLLGPDTCFSHVSAAVIHNLPLLNSRLAELCAVRTGGGHGTITPTLHARRANLEPTDIVEVGGYPVTSLARTTADLVKWLPFPEAVMVADAALARGLARDELIARTATGRGCRMAARALQFADPRAESAGESLSRVRMHKLGLPMPELQHNLYDAHGALLARCDFWWDDLRLAGEFDGQTKYGKLLKPGEDGAQAIMAEKKRELAVQDSGAGVVRWIWQELWREVFETRLRAAMRSRRALIAAGLVEGLR